uniref:Uncharacterized protein n=1 Tax=Solanum lycopersicum TaxID=4081 RepID=A0A3Q7IE57_SOLLC
MSSSFLGAVGLSLLMTALWQGGRPTAAQKGTAVILNRDPMTRPPLALPLSGLPFLPMVCSPGAGLPRFAHAAFSLDGLCQ